MPSKSDKQHNFMAMSANRRGRKLLRAHGKKPAPVKVAKEYLAADKAQAARKGKKKSSRRRKRRKT